MSDLNDQIITLAKQGVRPREIADHTGARMNTIYRYIADARTAGVDIPRFAGGPRLGGVIHVSLSKTVVDGLADHAAIRGISAARLANRLLREIVVSDLVGAVLDDTEWLTDQLREEAEHG